MSISKTTQVSKPDSYSCLQNVPNPSPEVHLINKFYLQSKNPLDVGLNFNLPPNSEKSHEDHEGANTSESN